MRWGSDMRRDGITIELATREDVPAIHAMLRALSATLDKEDAIQSSPEDIARYGFGDACRPSRP